MNAYAGISQETLAGIQRLLANDANKAGITTQTGLTAINLEPTAKLLTPIFSPFRSSTPRKPPVNVGGGLQPQWRTITSFNSAQVQPYVNQGQRGTLLNYTVNNASAPYVTLGLENNATFEAESAGVGYEDIDNVATLGLVNELFKQEEKVMIGGNGTTGFLLGQPGTILLTDEASGGTIGTAALTVGVVALTLDGYTLTSTNSAVPQVVSNPNAGPYGGTTTYNGGASPAAATQTITPGGTGHSVVATVPAVAGAVAYAWFMGTGGAAWFAGISTINSFNFTAVPANTGQVYSTLSTVTDYSRNALAFNGILSTTATGGYTITQPTGTVGVGGAGTGLTAASSGGGVGIVEFENLLKYMWNTYNTSIGEIHCNAQELNNIANKILQTGAGVNSIMKFNYSREEISNGQIVGGAVVGMYLNKYTMNGPALIPIKLHPYVPAGTIIFRPTHIPYQITNVGNIMEMDTRHEYYELQWPLVARQREWGVYVEEVLKIYVPFAFAQITNIANL